MAKAIPVADEEIAKDESQEDQGKEKAECEKFHIICSDPGLSSRSAGS